MKSIRINKYFYIISFCVLTVFGHIAFGSEAFENNLIKMDVYENSLGAVKVNLYTSKPYADAVSVNKKSDSEYVILMPETSNSMMTSPSVKSNIVKNVEVKTQQYGNQVKGYTKIIISTNRPVEITPQVQNIGTKLSEKDYNELLSNVGKKASTSKASKAVAKKQVVTVKSEPKSAAVAKKEAVKKEVVKPVQKPVVQIEKPKTTAQKPIQKIETKPQVVKVTQPVQQPVQKVAQKPVAVAPQKPVAQPKVTPQAQTTQVQPKAETVPENVAVTTPVQTAPVAEQVPQEPVAVTQPVVPQVVIPPAQPESSIQKYKRIIKNIVKHFVNNNSIYTIAAVVLIPLLLFFLLVRIVSKAALKFKQQKSDFKKNLQDSPQGVTDYSEKIDENMTWREKFQAYTDMSKKAERPETDSTSALPSSQELDDLFGEESFHEEAISEPSQEEQIFEEKFEQGSEVSEQELEQVFEPSEIEEAAEFVEDISYAQESPPTPSSVPSSVSSSSLDEFDINMDIDEEEISIDELFGEEEEIAQEPYSEVYQEDFDYQPEQRIEEQEEGSNLVKSEFNIDDERGFYLVDFEEATALVGHIADEIFVLKKFDKKIDATLQARLDERKGNSTNYMTRVGNFKALVEVTPQKMNLLIEL